MAGLSQESRTRLSIAAHALDPLTPEETAAAAAAVRASSQVGPRIWFETIVLAEPDKAEVRAATAIRQAYVCVFDPDCLVTARATVDLATGRLHGFDEVPGAMARITADEFSETGKWVARHPAFMAALRRRGIDDPSLVLVEPWAAGHFG
ncbi:MAG: tyramine oxidase, partial [Geminicoccaceae bacterium]